MRVARGAARMKPVLATGNLKSTWVLTTQIDSTSRQQAQDSEYKRRATQFKNIWIPHGG